MPEDANSGLEFKDAITQFKGFIGDLPLVSHKKEFEYGFMNKAYQTVFGKDIKNPHICTLRFAHQVFGDTIARLNLKLICIYFKVQAGGHRAYFDTVAMAKCFVKMVNKIEREKSIKLDLDYLINLEPVPRSRYRKMY